MYRMYFKNDNGVEFTAWGQSVAEVKANFFAICDHAGSTPELEPEKVN